MTRILVTSEQVGAVFDEMERRISIDVREGYIEAQDIPEYRKAMLQGVYGTLMAISANWPDVVRMMDVEEENRGYWKEVRK